MNNKRRFAYGALTILCILIIVALCAHFFHFKHVKSVPNQTADSSGLVADLYPLPTTISWGAAIPGSAQFGDKTFQGLQVASLPIGKPDSNFLSDYDTKLKKEGWTPDIQLEADGIAGSLRGYRKGTDVVIISYQTTPLSTTVQDPNVPGMACPCTTVYIIFSGKAK